jgi:hypothetical protein
VSSDPADVCTCDGGEPPTTAERIARICPLDNPADVKADDAAVEEIRRLADPEQRVDTLAALLASPALLVGVEAALNLSYGDDPYRPDIGEILGDAVALAVSDVRDKAEDMASCFKHDNCAAKSTVLFRLAEWLEDGVHPERAS